MPLPQKKGWEKIFNTTKAFPFALRLSQYNLKVDFSPPSVRLDRSFSSVDLSHSPTFHFQMSCTRAEYTFQKGGRFFYPIDLVYLKEAGRRERLFVFREEGIRD